MVLKRSEAIQPLSRQHHNGLLFCLLLKKGVRKHADLEVMREFIQEFWYKDLLDHFNLEENYLIPLHKQYHQLQAGFEKMMRDHYELKNIINENSLAPTYKSIEELRIKLEAHIRFEERELFPLIEGVISESQRNTIGAILSKEQNGNCMNYPVKFWE